jgi:hypothetical protein
MARMSEPIARPVNNRNQLLGFPKSYAFVIGINHYPDINADLISAVPDAKALARILKQEQGFDHVELLLGVAPDVNTEALHSGLEDIIIHDNADGETIRNLLRRIRDANELPQINPGDCIVFYYAGHGKAGEFDQGPAGFLLPSDARPEKAVLEGSSLLPMEEVFNTLAELDCHHTLLILDCCFAGKFRQVGQITRSIGATSFMPMYEERFERFKKERAWQVLVSAGPHQTAADWMGDRSGPDAAEHSPFAQALIDALAGKAEIKPFGKNLGDGILTSQELFLYLWNQVESITSKSSDFQIQYPDLFPMGNHRGGQFIFFDPKNPLNFANRVLRNPYKGLQVFEPEDSDLFFGRKAVIGELLEKLKKTNLLCITAPSASGKSSLVRAGLFPALPDWKNEAGGPSWAGCELLVLCPGAKAWSGEPALAKDGQKIKHDTGLKMVIEQRLRPDKKQLLLIDQLENFFTDCTDPDEKSRFEAKLIELYREAPAKQLKIVLTLRSDYEWLLETSGLGKALQDNGEWMTSLYRLPAIQPAELREALISPAEAELFEFETDQLVETILSEIGHAPGALPMLSFTMAQFYQKTDKDTRVFTPAMYREIGGVNGALGQYADEVYAGLSVEKQGVMRKLMLRMVQVNSGAYGRRRVYVQSGLNFQEDRNRAFLNEFDYPDHQDALVQEVLNLLEEKQLILGGMDKVGSYLEPVHDSLIQHWNSGKQWIEDFGAENLNIQRHLWQAVLENTLSGKDNDMGINLYGAERNPGGFSKLWDTNPKLNQVLGQLSRAAQPLMDSLNFDSLIDQHFSDRSPENQEYFRSFWHECEAKKEIPDLNALILSGYSDKLLDLMLEKGDHWLNQAEAEFVRQSWQKRIEDIVALQKQRDEAIRAKKAAEEALQRTVDEVIEASWKTGTYLEQNPGPDSKSGDGITGIRTLYETLKLLMSLKKAQSLSPVPIFLKGPHREEFQLDAKEFGHYNPEFLVWAKKNAIPARNNKFLRNITKPFYDAYLSRMVRVYYLSYQYLERNEPLKNQVIEEYSRYIAGKWAYKTGEVDNGGSQFLSDRLRGYPDKVFPYENEALYAPELGVLAWYYWDVSASFWIRRHIDTTAVAFYEIINILLSTYDEEWLASPTQLPAD